MFSYEYCNVVKNQSLVSNESIITHNRWTGLAAEHLQ